jgi:hypothetical protein
VNNSLSLSKEREREKVSQHSSFLVHFDHDFASLENLAPDRKVLVIEKQAFQVNPFSS